MELAYDFVQLRYTSARLGLMGTFCMDIKIGKITDDFTCSTSYFVQFIGN